MAVDMFLKLGNIKGESVDGNHKDSIDVLAWSWGMNQSSSTHTGGGGGSGKVHVQDISFTKYIDASSHALIQACCNGEHFDKALLTVRKAGKTPIEYIKISMEEVIISSVNTGGSGGEDRLTENITLNFAKFKYEYTTQDKTGGQGNTMTANWDIAKNQDK